MTELLRNPSFEDEYQNDHRALYCPVGGTPQVIELPNTLSPPHWIGWYRHSDKWLQPEWHDTADNPDPVRTRPTGEQAMQQFAQFKRWWGGFKQDVEVEVGQKLRLNAWAHAWARENNQSPWCKDGKCWSEGPGYKCGYWLESYLEAGGPLPAESREGATRDHWRAMRFRLGIDPIGGNDPASVNIVWGEGAFIYNCYEWVPTVEAVAQATTVSVWLECKCQWGYVNNDAYWDDVSLVVVGEEPPEPPEPPTTGHSKIGGYFLKSAAGQREHLLERPAIVLMQDDYGLAGDVMNGTLLIGRVFSTPDGHDAQWYRAQGYDPGAAAAAFVQHQASTYAANPAIKYWCGFNEPVFETPEDMRWYADLEINRIRLMRDAGLKCVIGNFATGTPHLHLWPYFMPAIEVGVVNEAILGLHEYANTWMWWMTGSYQVDPNEDQGDEGWTTLRYRKVYRQHIIPRLSQMGLPIIPLAVTELGLDPNVGPEPPNLNSPGGPWKKMCSWWSDHDNESDCAAYYMEQLAWYDQELQKDDYVAGAVVFTWGSYDAPWSDFDIANTPVAKYLTQYVHDNPARAFEYPTAGGPEPPTDEGLPRIDYKRTYNVIRKDATEQRAVEIFLDGWRRSKETAGGSYDDGGIGKLSDKTARLHDIPVEERPAFTSFYQQYYPGTKVKFVTLGQPPTGPAELKLAYPTTHLPAVITSRFGEDRGSYIHMGLDLRSSWSVWQDMIKCAFPGEVTFVGLHPRELGYGWQIKTEVDMADGRHVRIRYAHLVNESHLVNVGDTVTPDQLLGKPDNTGNSSGDHLHIDVQVNGVYVDPEPLIKWPDDVPEPPEPTFTLRGTHDIQGADWLKAQGLQGWCTVPVYLNTSAQTLNWQAYEDAGIRMIANLRYSYAVDDGGQGTMPGPDKIGAFETAVIQTMQRSSGVWGYVYCNEMNNGREWPAGFSLIPGYYLSSYNRIVAQVPEIRISPGAIDPYNPGWGDWRETWRSVLDGLDGVDFFAMHAYCHGPGPIIEQIWHEKKFGDAPLVGVYYDLRVLESQQAIVPARFADLPIVVTECNHFMKRDGAVGWDSDAGAWTAEAYRYFASRNVAGACLFRHNYDQWRMGNLPQVLDALRGISP